MGSIAAFVTTPPPVPPVLDYNARGTYMFLLLSFGLNLGGVIVGSAIIYVQPKADRTCFLQVRK